MKQSMQFNEPTGEVSKRIGPTLAGLLIFFTILLCAAYSTAQDSRFNGKQSVGVMKGTPFYASPKKHAAPIGRLAQQRHVNIYEKRGNWLRVKRRIEGKEDSQFVWLDFTDLKLRKTWENRFGYQGFISAPTPKQHERPFPVVEKPDCETLRQYWRFLYQKVTLLGWSEDHNFECPSEKSNIAMMFYYLDEIDVVDSRNKEKFDYFHLVASETKEFVKTSTVFSEALGGLGETMIDTAYTRIHLKGVTIGLESPAMLVHELAHHLSQTRHVKCRPEDKYFDCDAEFFDIYGGEGEIGDANVGAYSVGIAYITDVIAHGLPNPLTRSINVRFLERMLRQNFRYRSPEYPNGITEEEIQRVLDRVR